MTSPAKVQFQTYFGDYILGLFITWQTQPTSNTGTSDIQFDWRCNLRGRLDIFGYGIAAADDATAALYYKGVASDIVPDAPTTWTGVNGAKITDWADATAIAGNKPTVFSALKTNTGAADNTRYRINIVWQNPNVQGVVTYDGLEAKIYYKHTAPPEASWADAAAMAATPPTISYHYEDNVTLGMLFDIHPATASTGGVSTEDKYVNQSDGSNDINFVDPLPDATTKDLCTEKWYLSATAITCVEMQGSLIRKRNTGDYKDDINLDFTSSYKVSAMIGRLDDSAEQFKFAAQDVDFKSFFSGARGPLDMSTSVAIVSTLVYACVF